MATSLKLSELQELTSLTSDDLFLVTDLGSSSSRKVTYATLTSSLVSRIESLETSIDDLDIDIASETLNSISELSAALGDDPQIITNLQAELTAYKAHIEERNLQLALAFDVPTYAEIIYGG